MYIKRLKLNLINKLSDFDIFNMNCKSISCKANLKMELRITHCDKKAYHRIVKNQR